MILSEGAGAVLLARNGEIEIDAIHTGANFSRRQETSAWMARILSNLANERSGSIVASANGTFVDLAERAAVLHEKPELIVYAPKPALGESVGPSAIWQIIVGAQALRTKRMPPLLHVDSRTGLRFSEGSALETSTHNTVVLSCGLNQQIAGLRLSL
jgi:3-oxoacyl-(acyl-carrier-protein) synthase